LSVIPQPPIRILFPYATLFRSPRRRVRGLGRVIVGRHVEVAHDVLALELHVHGPAREVDLTPVSARDDALLRRVPRLVAGGLLRSEEHTSALQSRENLVCRPLL